MYWKTCFILLLLFCSSRALARETRNEIYPYAGGYFGDSLESSWMVGAEYMHHFSNHFGLGFDVGHSKADYNENRYYNEAGFFTNTNIHILDATGMFSFPTEIGLGKHVIATDLLVLLGGGTIIINSSYEPHGFIGGGVKVYTGLPWLAWRTDVKSTFHTTGKPGGANEFDVDILLTTGLSFQLPPSIKNTH